ncbi:MAG: HAD family hydrolase, partial [Candidatus Nanohaloarchaea archaeon]
ERMNRVDAVLFDNDGVIVDSEQYWHDIATDLFQEATADTIDGDAALADALGMNYREIYDLLADRYDVTMDRQTFIQRYEDAADEIYRERVSLMDGFHDLVEAVTAEDCLTAIVSSSPQRWLNLVVDRFDLDGIDEVISADTLRQTGEIDAGKPAPDVYRATARRLGVDPSHCLVVEDSVNGVNAATAAGMTCIAYGQSVEGADATALTPQELRTLVLAAVREKVF